MGSLLALFFTVFVLGMVPGPAVFATIARALSKDLKSTYLFILGILVGDAFFALLAMMGLAVLAMHYMIVFLMIKIIGGGYLIYLGVVHFKNSKMKDMSSHDTEKGWRLVTSGFVLTASNPKDLIFFVSLLPAFINLETASINDIILVAFVVAFTFLITLSLYAVLANSMKRFFQNSERFKILNRIVGTTLICVGLFVIYS